MLQQERRRGRVANRAAMRAAVRQRDHRILALQQALHEIQIAVGIVEQRKIDEPRAVIPHQ